MSGVSLPVTRPTGRGLLVGSPGARVEPANWLHRLGCDCVEIDDPYAAMAELATRPTAYSSLVLSLATLFREELQIIAVAKRRYPDIEIWLTRPDGRNAALDEAMRLGADGYLAEDGLHRLGPPAPLPPPAAEQQTATQTCGDERTLTDPVLTAEELRALLDDPPAGPATA
jgi:hypothetical protein